LLCGSAWSQTASDLNEGTQIAYDALNGVYTFSWWGVEGRTYFVQQSDNLVNWVYLPLIESGDDEMMGYGFETDADWLFFRLVFTDHPTEDPAAADFDNDGISN